MSLSNQKNSLGMVRDFYFQLLATETKAEKSLSDLPEITKFYVFQSECQIKQ